VRLAETRGSRVIWTVVLTTVVTTTMSVPAMAQEGASGVRAPRVWVTWRGTEPDKGASAWFLKRFVRADIVFRELPTGTTELGEGTPFDVPQAEFRRTHSHAVFETLLQRYPVDDPVLRHLARVLHDVEINMWGAKLFEETAIIEGESKRLGEQFSNGHIPLDCYVAWFDDVYVELRAGQPLEPQRTLPAACRMDGSIE
jgi:hypothetical protein